LPKLYKARSKKEFSLGQCLTVTSQGDTVWLYLPSGQKLKMDKGEAKRLAHNLDVTLMSM
jgi:hypothetical protein